MGSLPSGRSCGYGELFVYLVAAPLFYLGPNVCSIAWGLYVLSLMSVYESRNLSLAPHGYSKPVLVLEEAVLVVSV